jgi:hypothetical protein
VSRGPEEFKRGEGTRGIKVTTMNIRHEVSYKCRDCGAGWRKEFVVPINLTNREWATIMTTCDGCEEDKEPEVLDLSRLWDKWIRTEFPGDVNFFRSIESHKESFISFCEKLLNTDAVLDTDRD